MPSPTPRQAAAAKLDAAYASYAHDQSDGFGSFDWQGAYDYREEGYRLGEEAADMPAEDRAEWIDGETHRFEASARYLIACAADFRVEELAPEASRQAVIAKTAMTLNFGSGIAA